MAEKFEPLVIQRLGFGERGGSNYFALLRLQEFRDHYFQGNFQCLRIEALGQGLLDHVLQMQEVAGKQVFNGEGRVQKNEEFILPTQMPEPCQFQKFSFVHAAEKHESHPAVSVNPAPPLIPQVKAISVQAVHPAMKTVDLLQNQ